MDFTFSEEQKKLMKEVGEFCSNELPEDYDPDYIHGLPDVATHEFWRQFHNKGVKRGWPMAGWPKEYGGMGLTVMEQAAINSEIAYWGATWERDPAASFMTSSVFAGGTEEQKRRWIPEILKEELTIFQAFTEPEAGSDEANMQLRAVADGDDFVLNGQKTFITGLTQPDWLYTVVRTADTPVKHRGLSVLMVPGNAPGITYRPQPGMAGQTQNEIFFDNVRVPKNNLLGELNRGFYLAMINSEFERSHGGGLGAKRDMERIVQFCREEKRNGKPLYKDPKAREMLARLTINSHLGFLFGWYTTWRRANRAKVASKTRDVSAILQRTSLAFEGAEMMKVFGLYGQLKPNSKYAKYKGKTAYRWEAGNAIHGGGTPEIRKLVIANRVLGLPRVPRQFNAKINEALGKKED